MSQVSGLLVPAVNRAPEPAQWHHDHTPAGTWQVLDVVNRDGNRLECRYFPVPQDDKGTGTPSPGEEHWLVKLHANNAIGGTDASACRAFREFGASVGCGVVIYNYRGVGGSQGTLRCARDLVADTEAVVEALVSLKGADRSRVHLYGHSIGGAVGLAVRATEVSCRGALLVDRSFGSLGSVMAAHSVGVFGAAWGLAVGVVGVPLTWLVPWLVLGGPHRGWMEIPASIGLLSLLGATGSLRWPWEYMVSMARWDFELPALVDVMTRGAVGEEEGNLRFRV